MSQAIDRLLVGRIAHELVSADPFDQHDLARLDDLLESRLHRRDGSGVIANPRFKIGLIPNPYRPALKASDGLGVESPIVRIGVFLLATLAQREGLQGRSLAIEGGRALDRVPRTAPGATDHGIKKSPVRSIEQFAQAIFAGCQVGQRIAERIKVT
jgi:hypothetical protein